jgi:hypothetical protein
MLMVCISSIAQEKEKSPGEIESVQYEIVVEKKITLPPASRNFEKVAPRPAEPIKPEITYEFKSLNFNSADFNPSIRPLRLQTEAISKLYGNYISAGFGNYASPYLTGYLTNKRDREKFYGASFYHRSFGKGAVDDSFSGSGTTEVRLFGNSFGKNVTVGGFLDYENRGGYFYGYQVKPAEKKNIKQDYTVVSLGLEVKNTQSGDFNYLLKTGFSYLDDHYKAKESEVSLNFTSDYQFKNSAKLLVNADYFLIAREDAVIEAKPRHLLNAKAGYQFSPLDGLKVLVGTNVAIENDTLGKEKAFHLYPDVKASYDLSSKVEVYSALTGGIDKVSLHTLSRENIWLNSNVDIFHTNRMVEFSGGIKGRLGSKISFNAGTSLANLKNLYFFQNYQLDQSKFNVYYDTRNSQRVNLFAEMGVAHSNSVKFSLRGDVFSYSTSIIDEVKRKSTLTAASPSQNDVALHRPTFRVGANFYYNLYDKILFSANLVTLGGMKAIDFNKSTATKLEVVNLKSAMDLSGQVDYFLSKQFTLFVKLDNVLANQYPVYLNYPVRGIQVLGGASWSF